MTPFVPAPFLAFWLFCIILIFKLHLSCDVTTLNFKILETDRHRTLAAIPHWQLSRLGPPRSTSLYPLPLKKKHHQTACPENAITAVRFPSSTILHSSPFLLDQSLDHHANLPIIFKYIDTPSNKYFFSDHCIPRRPHSQKYDIAA